MNLKEWLNQQEDFHLVAENFTEEEVKILRIGWDAALDEAAKVAENNAGYSSGNAAKLFIAEEIKELKE